MVFLKRRGTKSTFLIQRGLLGGAKNAHHVFNFSWKLATAFEKTVKLSSQKNLVVRLATFL